jgi:uncharacterized protein YndB with AHSA1/START domain
MNRDQIAATDRQLVFHRLVNAPQELVFDVWTNAEHLAKWFGPDGFTISTHSIEVKKNGVWHFTMHGPDGRNYKNKILYIEVLRPERLVYQQMDDETGLEHVSFLTTIEFRKSGTQTALSMTMIFESADDLQRVAREYGAIEGAKQTLARMDVLLAKLTNG